MLRLIALFVLFHVVAAQSPSANPVVLVNGGGTMNQNQNQVRSYALCSRGSVDHPKHDLRVQALRRRHM